MKFLYFLNKNLIYIKLFLFIYNKIIKYFNNNWGLGIGDWGLGIGEIGRAHV